MFIFITWDYILKIAKVDTQLFDYLWTWRGVELSSLKILFEQRVKSYKVGKTFFYGTTHLAYIITTVQNIS